MIGLSFLPDKLARGAVGLMTSDADSKTRVPAGQAGKGTKARHSFPERCYVKGVILRNDAVGDVRRCYIRRTVSPFSGYGKSR